MSRVRGRWVLGAFAGSLLGSVLALSLVATPASSAAPGPSPVTDLEATPALGSATLTWTNPSDSDWAETVVRRTVGNDKPALTPSAGTNVYDGRHDTATATGLAGGTDYTFTAYAKDADGNYSDLSSVSLLGNVMTATGPSRVVAGSAATLRGRGSDWGSNSPLRNRTVSLEKRLKGTDYWVRLATTSTDVHGLWSYVVHPGYTWDYRASYHGGGFRLGVTSLPTRVSVTPRVSLSADHTRGSRHSMFRLTTGVYPRDYDVNAPQVTLQRLTNGHWRNIDSKPAAGRKNTVFVARPGHRGTFSFRVVRPADTTQLSGVSRVVTLHVA